jgi:hypothetical protein
LRIDLSKPHLHAHDGLHELAECLLRQMRTHWSESRSNFGGELLVPVHGLVLAVHVGPSVSRDPADPLLSITAFTFRTYVRQMT